MKHFDEEYQVHDIIPDIPVFNPYYNRHKSALKSPYYAWWSFGSTWAYATSATRRRRREEATQRWRGFLKHTPMRESTELPQTWNLYTFIEPFLQRLFEGLQYTHDMIIWHFDDRGGHLIARRLPLIDDY